MSCGNRFRLGHDYSEENLSGGHLHGSPGHLHETNIYGF